MSASCNTTALFQSYNMTKMTREQMLFRHDSEEIKRVAFQGHIMPGMGSNCICYKCIARLAEICVVYLVNLENENENKLKVFLPFFLYQSLFELAKCKVIILICKYQARGFFLHHYYLTNN